MPLTSADVLTPTGEIDGAAFYPSLSSIDVSARLTTYLSLGDALALTAGLTGDDADRLSRTYTYYRAWDDVVRRLTLTPSSVAIGGELSASFMSTQITEWINRRDAWQRAYLELLPPDSGGTTTAPPPQAVPTAVRF